MLRERLREKRHPTARLCLDSILSLREVDGLLLCLLGGERGLVLGESSSDGAGLLGSEIEGEISC